MWYQCYAPSKEIINAQRHPYMEKQRSFFDVTMGGFNLPEVYKLVNRYILNLLSKKYNKNDLDFTVVMDWPFYKIKVDRNKNR